MTRQVLMIAYHFPPLKGSSGIQRTLKFSQYLPDYGWNPIVLTVKPEVYENTSDEQLHDISPETKVIRAFAIDSQKNLSIKGFYPSILMLPDRWFSWVFGGIFQGLAAIKKFHPSIIWSTYPIATAHLIGYLLHKLTGIPWIADLRDPMAQDGYPENAMQWRAFRWIEQIICRHASAICFTSPSAIEVFLKTHHKIVDPTKLQFIPNGYDEESFVIAQQYLTKHPRTSPIFTIVHSGVVYPSERDPSALFQALGYLHESGHITPDNFRLILRASGHDAIMADLINKHGISQIVLLAPAIPYIEALAEMLSADGLLLLQAANCNHQIPAKIYEYLRTKRPIIALTDENGDTAKLIRQFPSHSICNIASHEAIGKCISDFMLCHKPNVQAGDFDVSKYSRYHLTEALSKLMNAICVNNTTY